MATNVGSVELHLGRFVHDRRWSRPGVDRQDRFAGIDRRMPQAPQSRRFEEMVTHQHGEPARCQRLTRGEHRQAILQMPVGVVVEVHGEGQCGMLNQRPYPFGSVAEDHMSGGDAGALRGFEGPENQRLPQ